jgi:general secretion pathway protein D
VLSITPHLVRTIQRPPAGASEFGAGTEASFRRRPDAAVRLPVLQPVVRPAVAPPVGQPPIPAAPAPVTGVPLSQPAGTAPAPYTVPAGVQVTPVPAPPPAK